MKVYIDLQKLAISKVVDGTSPEYAGDINSNVFEILFFNYDNTNWFPTMSQLAPNGREAGDFEADSLGVGETHDYTEGGVNYQRFTFTMGNAWVLMKGRSNLYVWYNVLNGAVLKKCVGKLNVMINESNDNYFISNPVFNPAVKTYIDSVASDIEDELNDKVDAQNATIASLSQASPSVFDTAANIQLLQENKGVAVATDTGYIWYWDTTITPNAYVASPLQYNSLANYTKHSGNQLQDANGNNIYPEINPQIVNAIPKETNYIEISASQTLSDLKPFYNTQYNLGALQTSSGQTTTIYPVTSGKKYLIKCKVNSYTGADANNPVAFIGTSIITTTSETTTFKQGITLNTAPTQPTDYNIEFIASANGYVYVRNAYNLYEIQEQVYYDVTKTRGVIKQNTSYTHFTKLSNGKYIFREFKPMFVNNLLQLYRIYIGLIVNDAPVLETLVGNSSSDNVGPVSIHRGNTDSWIGKWSGGGHGVTVGGVEYPTAEQTALSVYWNNNIITNDGIYYGDITIIAKNNLYYPQSVTSADLSTATLALIETRTYFLNEKMNVKVSLEGVNDGYINAYYGCQINTFNMAKVLLPNNEKIVNINPASTVLFDKPEHKICCSNSNGMHYDISVKNIGLGTYARNDGTNTTYLYGNVSTFNKIYYQLIAKSTGINSTRCFYWEAIYDFYID